MVTPVQCIHAVHVLEATLNNRKDIRTQTPQIEVWSADAGVEHMLAQLSASPSSCLAPSLKPDLGERMSRNVQAG